MTSHQESIRIAKLQRQIISMIDYRESNNKIYYLMINKVRQDDDILTPYLVTDITFRYTLLSFFNSMVKNYDIDIGEYGPFNYHINEFEKIDDEYDRNMIKSIYLRMIPYIDGITKSIHLFNKFKENNPHSGDKILLEKSIELLNAGINEEFNKITLTLPYNILLYREYLRLFKCIDFFQLQLNNEQDKPDSFYKNLMVEFNTKLSSLIGTSFSSFEIPLISERLN